jgi:AraC family transcriptional regulator
MQRLQSAGKTMTVILYHDQFYGALQLRRELRGLTLSHRVADRPSGEVEAHTHVEAHFVLVTTGIYCSSARGAAGIRPLVYNPPGTSHRDHFRDGIGSFFTVSVSPDHFQQIEVSGLREFASVLADPASRGVAQALLLACAREDPDLALESLCYELLGAPQQSACLSNAYRVRNGVAPHWLKTAYEMIEDDYQKYLTVRDLAVAAGVHPVHLARGFRTYFRCTPGDLLRLRRLERAADLMLFSPMTLAEIAVSCGFADQSHMTNAFHRIYGTSPGHYREIAAHRLNRALT